MSAFLRFALLPVAVFALTVPLCAEDEASPETTSAEHAGEEHAAEQHGEGSEGGADHGGKSGHGAESGHGDGHAEGVPGFAKDLALWSLVTFVCFLVVLKKAAWTPLVEGLDKRESGIRAAIAEAEENQRKSEALLAEYESKLRDAEQTVAEMVAEAKRDAERTSQDIVAKAQADVESMRQRATDDIGRAKDAALAEVFGSVNSRIALATEHVLGRALSGEDQERLVDEALAEIGS